MARPFDIITTKNVIIKMANTIMQNFMLLAATVFVLIVFVSVSEAAPFFTDNVPSVNLPSIEMPDFSSVNLPRIEMPNFSLPEIDPATMINNGGRAVARTSDGVIVMFNNGAQAFMRTSTGVMDGVMNVGNMFMRMARSLPFFG